MSQPEAAGPPHCFRHPDRETYIRCSRCERPICPDCMVAAPVGFHCPECLHDGARTVRTPRTMAGGRLITRPTVTYCIVAVCVAVFGLELLVGVNQAEQDYGMIGAYIGLNGEYYRLLTSAFMHVSLLHIGLNMWVLLVVAPMVERFLGHFRFALVYLFAALGGSIASYAFSSALVVSLGASGAIWGVMGGLVIVAHRIHADIRSALTLIALNLALSFLVPGVDWRAHLGGLFVGTALTALFAYAPRRNRLAVQALGVVGAAAVLVAVAAWRTGQLQTLVIPGALPDIHSVIHSWGRTTRV